MLMLLVDLRVQASSPSKARTTQETPLLNSTDTTGKEDPSKFAKTDTPITPVVDSKEAKEASAVVSLQEVVVVSEVASVVEAVGLVAAALLAVAAATVEVSEVEVDSKLVVVVVVLAALVVNTAEGMEVLLKRLHLQIPLPILLLAAASAVRSSLSAM